MTFTVLVNAGPWLNVPPKGYGGLENVVATLVPELRSRGVRVVLATAAGSTLAADETLATFDQPRFADLTKPYNTVAGVAHAHMAQVLARLRAGDIDLVHDHLEVVGPALLAALRAGAARDSAPPALHTLHWDPERARPFYESFDGHGGVWFNAVSQAQLDRAPTRLRNQALAAVPLSAPVPLEPPLPMARREPYVLALGRITALKGQDVAARVCRRAGVPLVLAGPVASATTADELATGLADGSLANNRDVDYWCDEVAPLVDGRSVRWVGAVGGEAKAGLLARARALVLPIQWEEPGATVVAEALAAGTPVVATPRGCLPSLVEQDVTGRLAADEDGLVAALGDLDRLDPERCRHTALERFSPARMAERYLSLYDEVMRRAGGGRRPPSG